MDDKTAIYENATTVISYFDGKSTTYVKETFGSVNSRKRRSVSTDSSVLACAVKSWFSSEFVDAQGGYSSAKRFAEFTTELASTYYESADISDSVQYKLNSAIGGILDPPSGLPVVDTLSWLTSNIRSSGCANLLFVNVPDDVRNGIAFVNGACSTAYNWAVINTLDPAAAGSIIAHEVGHLFNASHDFAPCSENRIMQPVLKTIATKFSECSLLALKQSMPTIPCLTADSISKNNSLGKTLASLSVVLPLISVLVRIVWSS